MTGVRSRKGRCRSTWFCSEPPDRRRAAASVRLVLTKESFVIALLDAVPEAQPLVTEHWNDHDGEVLLHLLVADVRRLSEDAWRRHDHPLLRRCLDLLDLALRTGDVYVDNAVAVSFVEDSRWWDSAVSDYIAAWPTALAAEVERQRQHRPHKA